MAETSTKTLIKNRVFLTWDQKNSNNIVIFSTRIGKNRRRRRTVVATDQEDMDIFLLLFRGLKLKR